MSAALKTAPRATPTWTRRPLTEAVQACDSPLKVDKDRRIIFGVKVLGRFSRNSHGLREAVNGTEYTPQCMREALPLYEGVEVMANHAAGPAAKARGVEDVLGVLRNARVEEDGIRADLHYLDSHRTTAAVLEDVERAIGVFGLSHDAEAGRERFDRQSRRLVIESLKSVKSVDLVRKPASNRNLWESGDMKTVRQVIESLDLSGRWGDWRKRLLEDHVMGPAMDAAAPDAGSGDLKGALMAALTPMLDDAFESGDPAKLIAALKDFVKLHAKHTGKGDAEPEEPKTEADEDGDKDDAKPDDVKTEALKDENEKLKHKLKVRQLCEEAGVAKPDKVLLESLEAVPEATARKLLEREKARGGDRPRSASIQTGGSSAAGDYKPAADAKEFGRRIKD